MNDRNWARSRQRLGASASRCEEQGHEWLAPDPVTGRRFCRRCVAFLPGLPDERMARLHVGNVGSSLGWNPAKGMTFNGRPNPAWPAETERRAAPVPAAGDDRPPTERAPAAESIGDRRPRKQLTSTR